MRREPVTFRLGEAPLAKVTELQHEYDVTFTAVMRACLAVAFEHMSEVRRILSAAGKVK